MLDGRVVREGRDLTIVAWGAMQRTCRLATLLLADHDVSAELIDPVSVKPFNYDLLRRSVQKTGRLLVVDEGPRTGSVAAEVIVRTLEEFGGALRSFRRVTFPDVHHPFDPRLEATLVPSVDQVAEAARMLAADAVKASALS